MLTSSGTFDASNVLAIGGVVELRDRERGLILAFLGELPVRELLRQACLAGQADEALQAAVAQVLLGDEDVQGGLVARLAGTVAAVKDWDLMMMSWTESTRATLRVSA